MQQFLKTFVRFDWILLFSAVALCAIGLLEIYGINSSRGASDIFQFQKQLISACLGVVLSLSFVFIHFRDLRAFALPIYIFGGVLLLLSLLFGMSLNGGGRWFQVGVLSFQPVELAKICFIIFLASYLPRYTRKRLTWTAFIGSGLALILYLLFIMLQPDFGSGMVLVAIWLVCVLFCGLPRHAWWMMLLASIIALPLMWSFGLKPYQKNRLIAFIDPKSDVRGAGYNVTQARIAFGSGGWFGKGVGEGSQARLRFLPVATSDFMFAVIGEEMGFAGISMILSLFGIILYRLLRIGSLAEDASSAVLLVGLAALIAFHLFVNAGMNIGISPVTGIPLPFVSAGASSLVVLFLAIGLAQSVATSSRFISSD
ncbi:rod shape-determining protein RodA [Candidatus Uhrbacteria bacterium]|nr:rod shape-determining protein RodA [Candidatus Uhrbacteria bacterium]